MIFGSSRILYDTDLDVWKEMTGRRPIQLALVGTSPRPFLKRFAGDSDFGGLVIVDVTPENLLHRLQERLPLNTSGWATSGAMESPSKRFGHQVGLILQRYFAFLDDNYSARGARRALVDIPDRPGFRRPYLEVWKLSSSLTRTGNTACGRASRLT